MIAVIFLALNRVQGQMPIIDSQAVDSWPSLSNEAAISNNGNYFAYTVFNMPLGRHTLKLTRTDNGWNKEFSGASFCVFTNDNRQAVFQKEDSLIFPSLASNTVIDVKNISSFKQPGIDQGVWLAYQPKSKFNAVVLRNLITDKERWFDSVAEFYLMPLEKFYS